MEIYDDYEELHTQPRRKPRSASGLDHDTAADIERRMAAMKVRRRCNEHDCQAPKAGTCNHPNHRQKVHGALEVLEMLGLDPAYPAYTEAEKKAWSNWLRHSGPPETIDGLGLEDAA